MEDAFGTIVYILISLVIILVSTLGRKKKSRGPQQPASGSSPLEKLAREFNLFDEPDKPVDTGFLHEDYPGTGEDAEMFPGEAEPSHSSPVMSHGKSESDWSPGVDPGQPVLYGGEKDMPQPGEHLIFQGEDAGQIYMEEGESLFEEEDQISMSEIKDIKDGELVDTRSDLLKEFDLRTAVVFSEILQRKYDS